MVLDYFLGVLIAFTGLFWGVALYYFAQEEIKPGRKYFLLFEKLLVVIAISILFYFKYNLIAALITFVVSLILFLIIRTKPISKAAYPMFGLILFFSNEIQNLFLLELIIVFLYGLPIGTLYALKLNKKPIKVLKKALVRYSPYFVFSILPYIIKYIL